MRETAVIVEMDVERVKAAFVAAFKKTDKSFVDTQANKREAARYAVYLFDKCRLTQTAIGQLVGKNQSTNARLIKWERGGCLDRDMWNNYALAHNPALDPNDNSDPNDNGDGDDDPKDDGEEDDGDHDPKDDGEEDDDAVGGDDSDDDIQDANNHRSIFECWFRNGPEPTDIDILARCRLSPEHVTKLGYHLVAVGKAIQERKDKFSRGHRLMQDSTDTIGENAGSNPSRPLHSFDAGSLPDNKRKLNGKDLDVSRLGPAAQEQLAKASPSRRFQF